jgi:hypothetical protein
MANEYLIRRFTSTGNLREGTFSFWLKGRAYDTNQSRPVYLYDGSNLFQMLFERTSGTNPGQIVVYGAGVDIRYKGVYRDPSAWSHYLLKVDNTTNGSEARFEVYVNGVRLEIVGSQSTSSASYPNRDVNIFNNVFYINGTGNSAFQCCDYFYIDGQALTPDVFGFYKQEKGYISAGSTQATDFRPGQWVPKTPRVIKTEINRRGGFGVNGFYLPMNDSKNFGADFHCDPNSIITLNEKLPQPRVGVATTASVGLGYTDALRADPYAANLVLALPFVSGGLSSGFGDYAPSIKGSGSAKTITNSGVSIASTASYYGSSMFSVGPNNYVVTSSSSDFNFGTGDFTVECWTYLLSQGNSGYNHYLSINDQNAFAFKSWGSYYYLYANSGTAVQTSNAPKLNQWTHLALVRKGTTLTIFENGVAAGITTNYTSSLGATAAAQIGNASNTTNEGLNGYIQDLRIYKGVAKYTGGFDVSRPYTPVGIATWRAVPDTTANNFATMNPLIGATPRSNGTVTSTIVTYTDGNLTTRNSANLGYAPAMQSHSTVGMTTGKWYWEVSNFSTTGNEYFGISKGNEIVTPSGSGPGIECLIGYFSSGGDLYLSAQYDGTTRVSATLNNSPGTGISSTSDVIGFAFDVTNSSLSVYRNGVLNNTATGIVATSNVREWFVTKTANSSNSPSGMSWNFGQNPTFSGNTTAGTFTDSNGKGLFKYQPPSGFLALCEDNLPTPAISDPGKHFKTVLYTGDGNSGRSIVGVGFTPDLIWIKSRSPSAYNHRAFDSVRGSGKDNFLLPNLTAVEGSSSDYFGGISSFNADGFSMVYGTGGSNIGINESGTNFVAWCWRAGAGTTSTNTNGSITSVVSVNQDAGFSIVSWTAADPAGDNTIGHGLGKQPKFIICKSRTSGIDHWVCYHSSLGKDNYILLSSTNGSGASANYWSSSVPSSTVFGVANSTSTSNNVGNMIAYCWAEIEGYSKFSSYVGNGNADGPFVYCGFKPAFVMTKNTTTGTVWLLWDNARTSANPNSNYQVPNNLLVDQTSGADVDFLSNGFKVRNTSTSGNGSGNTIIFAAFAESPFAYSNSK